MVRNCNPAFNKAEEYSNNIINNAENVAYEKASYKSVGLKLLYFMGMTLVGAGVGVVLLLALFAIAGYAGVAIGGIVMFVLVIVSAIIAMRNYKKSMLFGTIYCIGEGAFVGLISIVFEEAYPGIILTAITGTLATVIVCSLLFITGAIKVNSKFYKFLMLLGGGILITILLVYIIELIAGTVASFGIILIISILSVLLASICLIADMNRAYQLVSTGGPKEMEWMISFGLAYTILWIYVEVLRIVFEIVNNRK